MVPRDTAVIIADWHRWHPFASRATKCKSEHMVVDYTYILSMI